MHTQVLPAGRDLGVPRTGNSNLTNYGIEIALHLMMPFHFQGANLMRYVTMTSLSILLLANSGPSAEQLREKPKNAPVPNKLMAEKLKSAQTLLEGLAINDFDKITESAQELIRISKAAEFAAAFKTPMYGVHTNNFRRLGVSSGICPLYGPTI